MMAQALFGTQRGGWCSSEDFDSDSGDGAAAVFLRSSASASGFSLKGEAAAGFALCVAWSTRFFDTGGACELVVADGVAASRRGLSCWLCSPGDCADVSSNIKWSWSTGRLRVSRRKAIGRDATESDSSSASLSSHESLVGSVSLVMLADVLLLLLQQYSISGRYAQPAAFFPTVLGTSLLRPSNGPLGVASGRGSSSAGSLSETE
mmetsp:Transcript_25438/g.71983  ORF Transcript_25438/g.71983 Transcript_25438/m.71983 type:complete len:206 (-) Transcript_25438:1164-1781(-)